MYKIYLILLLITQANFLLPSARLEDRSKEIYGAISYGTYAFKNLTPTQEARLSDQVNKRKVRKTRWERQTQPTWESPAESPLEYAVLSRKKKIVSWLLNHNANVNDSRLLAAALNNYDDEEILEMLLLHNIPTDIKIDGRTPIDHVAYHRDIGMPVFRDLDNYEKAHDLLLNHEKLKLRWIWIRGLVQMEWTRNLQEMGARAHAASAAPADASTVEIMSQTGSTPVVITRAASPGMLRDTTPRTPVAGLL